MDGRHCMVLESDRLRIYKVALPATRTQDGILYGFHGLLVALAAGTLQAPYGPCMPGDVWEIVPGDQAPWNAGDADMDAYVVELRP